MSEIKKVWKWFWVWDLEKEERWLNEMALDGWGLIDAGIGKYTFERTQPGEYIVRIELHAYDESYLSFMRETGAELAGKVFSWMYFRRKSALGSFDIFSDLDSKIEHFNKISKMLAITGSANLAIGSLNTFNPAANNLGWINLICATLLMYALGRIHGKKESLESERMLRE